ncbi:MAG TPA: twin-arginine translocase TatA/TatE family subunit [Moraxellaceae bacterium]|nr:twin-arginine translocase TatA/TatE family subunit [Moraxellaceae bacterium]
MLSGLSLPHIILLLVIVVLIFGTGKLRNAGRDLGGFIKGFKEGMKSEDEKPQAPPQQLTQQDSTRTYATADKKDSV